LLKLGTAFSEIPDYLGPAEGFIGGLREMI
jgi:hypothetical protein